MPTYVERDISGNEKVVYYQPRDVVEYAQDLSESNARIQSQAMAQTGSNLVFGLRILMRILRYWYRIVSRGLLGERIGLALGFAITLLAMIPAITSGEYSIGYGLLLIATGFVSFGTLFAAVGGLINRVANWTHSR